MNDNLLKNMAEALVPYLMPYIDNKLKDEISSLQIPEKDEPKFLTRKEVVAKLMVTEVTLWRWEQAGKLVPVRVGSKVLYRISDVLSFIK